MKEQFVTYEIALKLKELGFDEPCLGLYYSNRFWFNDGFEDGANEEDFSINSELSYGCIAAPLWQQIVDWFREEKGIIVNYTGTYISNNFNPYWTIRTANTMGITSETYYSKFTNTIEEAREQAILKTIELCQKQK